MATTQLISVEEYLQTTYRPDVDYVDGEIQERNLGEYDHADVQSELITFLRVRAKDWNIRVVGEARVQVSVSRFRVPDVCVIAADSPREQVIHDPPLLCIEILSPSDTIRRIRERVRDYIQMGIQRVWVLDTESRTALVCEGTSMTEHTGDTLKLPGTAIEVPLAEIFSVLDE